MPTKKSAKKKGGKKGGAKKDAGKRNNVGAKKHPFDGDPPILVGGGGSTYVYILINYDLGRVATHIGNYMRYPVVDNNGLAIDITSIDVDDGNGGNSHHRANPRRHLTGFSL